MGLHAKKVPSIFFLQQVIKFIFEEKNFSVKTAGSNKILIQKKGGSRICLLL